MLNINIIISTTRENHNSPQVTQHISNMRSSLNPQVQDRRH